MAKTIIRVPGQFKGVEYGTPLANTSDLYDDNKKQGLNTTLGDLQPKLVSGTNIKTINNQSVLGEGNIEIQGGSAGTLNTTNTEAQSTSSSESLEGTVNLHKVSKTGSYNDLLDKPLQPVLATVATTGNYNDLNNKPLIPDVSGKADKSEMSVTPGTGADTDKTTIQLKQGTSATVLVSHQDISGKQDVINDLSTIRSGAASGATAQQPATTLAGYGITDAYTKSETYSKTEVNGLVSTPHQEYETVEATSQTTAATDVLPASGQAADTIYRVSNWDGSANSGTGAFDVTKYSEYAWDDVSTPNKYVFLCVKSQVGEVFDISVYNNNAKYADLAAALNGGANIPQSLQKGGISVKFVQSSDNKYVQYRLMADEWSANTEDWAIAEEGAYVENSEFVYVNTDKDNKILWAIRTNGDIYYGAGCPQQVKDYIEEKISSLSLDEYEDIVSFLSDYLGSDTTLKTMIDGINAQISTKLDAEGLDSDALTTVQAIENPEWLSVTADKDGRIIEGITTEGKKKVMVGIDAHGMEISSFINNDWLEVKTDNSGKIIEGVRKDGSKFIGQFDAETEKTIKNLTENSRSVINIPVLDADFDTNLPYKVYNGNVEDNSVKGTDAAKYVFDLGVQEDKDWIVRFKFRMTENIFNQERNAIIANIGPLPVTAIPIPLTQHQEQFEYEGVMQTENWPTYDGGIVFNYNSIDNLWENRNLGKQSFSVRYTGSGDIVTLENDGNGLILTVDGNITTYTFANYANVSELYAAMSANNELALQFISIDHRTCDELAKFGPIRLKDTFYVNEDGTVFDEGNEHPVEDNAPLFLRYAVPDNWFQVEMFKKGSKVYCICDGKLTTIQTSYVGNKLVLGGDCGVLFKDFVFCDNNTLDTEIVNGKVVSSVNPSVIIFECHGMYDGPSYTVTPQVCPAGEAFNSANPDSMEYFFSDLEKKGYLPVSIEDIASYYTAGTPLPKRCYVHIFDDRRWQICLNNELRRVFSRHNATPALAMITDVDPVVSDIIHNGETITKKQAVGICKTAGFSIISHTAKHRNVPRSTKPSDQEHFFEQDLYNADDIYANGSILVYPGGDVNVYNQDVMEFVGFKLGIEIYKKNNTPNYRHNRFMLSRVNIGRIIYNTGEFYDYDYYTDLII